MLFKVYMFVKVNNVIYQDYSHSLWFTSFSLAKFHFLFNPPCSTQFHFQAGGSLAEWLERWTSC